MAAHSRISDPGIYISDLPIVHHSGPTRQSVGPLGSNSHHFSHPGSVNHCSIYRLCYRRQSTRRTLFNSTSKDQHSTPCVCSSVCASGSRHQYYLASISNSYTHARPSTLVARASDLVSVVCALYSWMCDHGLDGMALSRIHILVVPSVRVRVTYGW